MFRRTRVELLSAVILPVGVVLAVGAAPGPETSSSAPAVVADGPVSFARQVRPILRQRCVDCHGGEATEVELNLATYEGVMRGSEYGTVVEAGDPAGSLLLEMIVAGEMPQEAPPLPADEVALIRSWIQQGAQNN